ncbi:hypothetical protein [Candidatus Electronema sp. TJ]|uniref:hypothetical protein n=1 Tax=Candidatus Electronema sp. TJ TaxID=3401573 RepID=UPI003AA90EA5
MNTFDQNKEESEFESGANESSSATDIANKTVRSLREICEECLKVSFYEDSKIEIRSLCKNKFPELGRTIGNDEHIDRVIEIILSFFEKNNKFDELWDVLRDKREKQCEKFQEEWERAKNKNAEDSSARFHEDQNAEIFKQQSSQDKNEDQNIASWFFNKLDRNQQSMVMTTALFQGVEKNIFNELVADVQGCLYPIGIHENVSKEGHPYEEEQEKSEDENKDQKIDTQPKLDDEQEQFDLAKIKIVSSYRYKEYGKTDVDIIIFEKQGYRKDVLQLLRHNISSKKKDIFYLIYMLGNDESWEKRSCARNAVAALSETDNFNELVEGIIKKWANSNDAFAQKTTAESLSAILREGRHEQEIFKLLNSWINKNNRRLVITRLLVYFFIADKFPEESMKAIESAVYSNPDHLPVKLNDIAVKIYNNERKIFISYVRNWTGCDSDALRQLAGAWFLRLVRLKDAAADQSSEKQTVEIISALWKDSQLDAAAKVREWAEETLSAFENDEQELFAVGQKLFHQLYPNCRKKLDYYLPKWQGYREYAQKKAAERRKGSVAQRSGKQANFFMLMPEEA